MLLYSYAIDDDNKVIWMEHFSMYELYYRQKEYGDAFYGDEDCGELDSLWKNR